MIDPGPDLAEHVAALLTALGGETVTHILVTHTHRDHSPAAAALKAATGAPTFGFGPHGVVGEAVEAGADLAFVPDRVLRDGDVVEGAGCDWRRCIRPATPRTSRFALADERALFSGDHVMGWSTTVISPPDGDMRDYMRSLERLRRRDDAVFWPTHGGAITDPHAHVAALIAHRRARRAAVLAALAAAGPARPADLVPAVYKKISIARSSAPPRARCSRTSSSCARTVRRSRMAACGGPPETRQRAEPWITMAVN